MIDRERLRRQQRRMAKGDVGNKRSDAQAGGLSRERSQEGPGFVIHDARKAEGVNDPGTIEFELLRFAPTSGNLGIRPTGEREDPEPRVHFVRGRYAG